MDDVVRQRLVELRSEMERGEQRLEQLEREHHGVRDVMLRISGAIRVLEELFPQDNAEPLLRTVEMG
jgi:hypothetical protein